VFDRYVTHRRNTGITVPTFPAGCSATAPVASELEDVISNISDEETFLKWLLANLRACCDDREDDIGALIALHAPTVAELEEERDLLMKGLFAYKGTGETLAEYTAASDLTYGDALIAGEVIEGYSNIMALVPAVPTECDASVVTSQMELITIAEAIESLETQIIYLQPLLDECCIAS